MHISKVHSNRQQRQCRDGCFPSQELRQMKEEESAQHTKRRPLTTFAVMPDGNSVVASPQRSRCGCPSEPLRLPSRRARKFLSRLVIFQQLDGELRRLVKVAAWVEESRAPVFNDVEQSTRGDRDARNAARHSLQYNETERLGLAGHHEDVSIRVSLAEVVSSHHAKEHGIRSFEVSLEFLTRRSVANEAQARVFKPGRLLHLRKDVLQVEEVLLRAKAAHADEQLSRPTSCHDLAHRGSRQR
mmetsp:Transcript_10197/g.27378  ORF Transcript_10197/g.27378 Transcript_10197/m.27378 type:complete len:243 (-) Transcript_10197:983-1711(-)